MRQGWLTYTTEYENDIPEKHEWNNQEGGREEGQREKERGNIKAFCDVMSWVAHYLMFQRTVSSEVSIPVFALQQSITSQMT
jgi:hypothetical protein